MSVSDSNGEKRAAGRRQLRPLRALWPFIQRHPGMIPTAMSIRPQSSSGRWRGLDFDQRIDRAGKTGRVGWGWVGNHPPAGQFASRIPTRRRLKIWSAVLGAGIKMA